MLLLIDANKREMADVIKMRLAAKNRRYRQVGIVLSLPVFRFMWEDDSS